MTVNPAPAGGSSDASSREGRQAKSRLRAGLLAVALCAACIVGGDVPAAELSIGDGVVVKFGSDAQLIVRDHLRVGTGTTFTSQKDDATGGPTGATPQTPALADWRGIRLEKSVASTGAVSLNDVVIRYAGSSDGAALTARGNSAAALQFVQFTDSTTGLRVVDGAHPSVNGAAFLRNATALEADGNAAPTVSASQFAGNTTQAILNKTPLTVIQATGNWWGHASGPQDATGNPQGQGNAVSAGVNYSGFLAAAPLLNPSIKLATPAAYFEQRDIQLDIACVNAVDYRIAEGTAFSGVAFQTLSDGHARVPFTLSAGDGRKQINVQFRDSIGTIVTAALANGVLLDTLAPTVTLTPATGSVVNKPTSIVATATDASGIAQVQFTIDDVPVATRSTAPYTYTWNTDGVSDGVHVIKAVATDAVGRVGERTVSITLTHIVVPPDTAGPQLTGISLQGVALADGASITRNGSLTFTATDASGIARIELLRDGSVVAVASGSGSYTVPLVIDGVANGPHTLALRAVDSLGNSSTTSYSVTVAHALPNAPVLSLPASGTTVPSASVTVSGTAQAASQIQILLNTQATGVTAIAGSDGRFSAAVSLNPGSNQIQATATDSYGTSPLSNALSVTLDDTVPASPGNLTAVAQPAGKVHLTWTRSTDPKATGYHLYRATHTFTDPAGAVRVNSALLGAAVTAYDDLPPQDATWFYALVAVNAAGTASPLTALAQTVSDGTLPRARSIAYAPLGKTDAATGRIGQGRVDVTVTVSEALSLPPYLSLVPSGGGNPLTVDLVKTSDTVYTGSFLIDATVASGTANAIFSARDLVGNRGTDIDAGATLKIDTDGPSVTGIVVSPAAPIKADTSPTLQATLTYSKAPAAMPQVSYLLSGVGRSATSVGSLSQITPTSWRASFSLPSNAGQGSPETLSFSSRAIDDLDNISTKISGANRYQVYQGNLPPLNIPLALTAKAQPGGKVNLSWQAVDDAFAYQLYRQAPGQTELQPLARSGGVLYTDTTTLDGTHTYAVASVRQANGQEALSGLSASVSVVALANAPGAPQNLTLALTGQGIYATWQPPASSTVDYYNLYRAGGTSLTSLTGLTPLKTRIKNPVTYDSVPSPTQGAYVVTAVDAAGNESAPSNSAYLNASLLPVTNLLIEQLGSNLPVVSWNAPNGNVAGYRVYLGPDASRITLTPTPITATRYTDTGYTSGERRYSIATVDANGVEMARSLLLPNVAAQIAAGLPLKRGVMNQLQVQVSNASSSAIDNLRVVVRLPINKDATQFKDQKSDLFTLAANQTRLIPIVVGGYSDMPGAPQVQVGVEITPHEGELVRIARTQTVDVIDSALVVGLATDEFTRGATGKLKLTIENTSEIDVEFLTATGNGTNDSSELRFKILDPDGNVLATQAYKQAIGANVVTLTNGLTVARIPAGSSYVSDVFSINVPAASPNTIRVKLEVDKLRYHSGQDDEVIITGRGSEKTVSLADTAYFGELTDVSPLSSFGDQDVVITGRALARVGNAPLPNTRLKLILNQQGFERVFSVLTDGAGSFSYTFKPTLTDSGLYKVSAVHPDVTDRPEQKAFTINRVVVGPSPYKLDQPRNVPFTIPLIAKSGVGTTASNLRLVLDPASQPTGQVPVGITAALPPAVNLVERQTLNLPVVFTAGNDAQPSGSLIFNALTDAHGSVPIGQIRVDYVLSEAKPAVVGSPSMVETGLAQGGSQIESVSVQNKGLQTATNMQFSLSKPDGSPAPSWVSIASNANGNLAVGEQRSIDLSFNPPASLAEGVYEFRLIMVGDNVPRQTMNIYASVTQSGQGNVLFKAADIYTATIGKDGRLIPGLANASVTMQNEDVATVSQRLTTDSQGEVLFQNLPAGRYQFRASAANHQEIGGRLLVKPGITLTQPVFLDYNTVTVEWSVREITIQDRYEITLNATFETNVPAAVVVMQPASINLPKMNAGDVYFGELSLSNQGLVRADHVRQKLPVSDGKFRFEFLSEVPTTLEAKQRVTIPYRIVALQSLDVAATSGTASGGGCYSYGNSTSVSCDYTCANGAISTCGASAQWFAVSNTTCAGAGGAGTGGAPVVIPSSGGGVGGSSGGGGSFGGSSLSTTVKMKGKKCVFVPRGGITIKKPCISCTAKSLLK